MRKIQEVLRLMFDSRLSQHEVARALQIGQPTGVYQTALSGVGVALLWVMWAVARSLWSCPRI